MRIAIRVDASVQIGTGHFMRCLTLADELKQRDARVRFISRYMPEHFRDALAEKGHEFILLGGGTTEAISEELDYAHWLGTSQRADLKGTIQALSDHAWDWLVVDHYALDARWESALRQTAKHILVIDDLADRQHDCDVLLDQNFYTDMNTRYIDKVPAHCRLLLGPRYALLRDEFRQLRNQIRPRTGSVTRVLIFFGGVDADNYTGSAIKALANLGHKGLHVDVVIGLQNPSSERIVLACKEHQFDCHLQTSRMAELMAAADLAIGAGGSATWERCCLGLPTFAICTVDNQVKQVADAASEGLLYAPEIKGDLTDTITKHLCALMENSSLRLSISRNAMQAVDGRGVLRTISNLDCSGITILVASQEDSKKLFEWRNDPTIREVSRNTGVITWEVHQKWITETLMSPNRLLLIGQRDGVSVGVVRFDILDNEAEVSIYVIPGIKELGLGRDLLQAAERWFLAIRPDVLKFHAHVLGANARSHRLFAGAGYQVETTGYSKRLHS
jgi:UDP-2,4-diacetamido-2,4,6-trideoxy-beta-L-altropyranose hydrolase